MHHSRLPKKVSLVTLLRRGVQKLHLRPRAGATFDVSGVTFGGGLHTSRNGNEGALTGLSSGSFTQSYVWRRGPPRTSADVRRLHRLSFFDFGLRFQDDFWGWNADRIPWFLG
jgi:hypothetical protein